MKIYTRTGDGGETSLFDGTRVAKADPRVEAYGDVDELNAWLGVVRASGVDPQIEQMLVGLQRDLFALGSRLADPAHRVSGRVTKAALGPDDVARLEGWIDTLDEALPPLRHFILPGGAPAAAALHLARAVCRRAERRIVALGPDSVDPVLVTYVNRLSDLLFEMGGAVNARAGAVQTEW